MHRPRTALLIAVAVAAACLSSPPDSRATTGPGSTNQRPGIWDRGMRPTGDSDQFTTKSTPPPQPTTSTGPVTSDPKGNTGSGGGGGLGRNAQQDGAGNAYAPVSLLDQFMRALIRAFRGLAEQ
jgi:hypothetical protein